ncbi:MAG: 4Fe-4S dicluster domain-containing protein [Draconibacterium sp.]|nr:4Fe-4S dicluster domain-containing protein [Draconibacterium sp.]
MTEFFYIISQFILLFTTLFLLLFLIYSVIENEKNVIKRTIPLIVLFGLLLSINSLGFTPGLLQITLTILFFVGLFVVVISFGNKNISYKISENKFDERDIMFSRMELVPGTEKFDNYYRRKPQNRQKDNLFRKEPGLLNIGSKFYNPLLFNAAAATFSTVDLLQPLVEGDHVKLPDNINIAELTSFIKSWTIKLGAVDVGFTLLQPHHLYSHTGRGEKYGEEIVLNHKFAIAFTVEMNHESLSFSPKGPIIMESSQQYLNAGTIAVQVAQFIRNIGFDARAHIDANYKLICPIVAQDAGLGTIGRMGLLLTPKLGARVRIGVITTNLNLEINQKPIDSTVIQFCEICKKCAVNCPANAILHDSEKNESIWQPWKINHEKCFTYWCKVGTDCGRCISVCPYSHPDNFIHNIIRWMIKQNPVNRWLALKLDNFFYNDKPALKPIKSWMGLQSGK